MPRTHAIFPLNDPAARERWRALWEISPQRSPFSSLAFADAITEIFPLKCELHLNTSDADDDGGALMFWKNRGPYRIAVVPPLTPQSGILLRTPVREADVNQRTSSFESLLEGIERRFQLIRLQLHPSLQDVRPATWRGWSARPYYTYQLCTGQDAVRHQSKRVREIVRSEQAHYTVEERPDAVSQILTLFAGSLARQRHAMPASPEQIGRLIKSLQAHGLVRLFTATRTGDQAPEAGVAVLNDGSTGYYWIAGSEPGPSMAVLNNSMLPALASAGVGTFDYVGANTPSISEFKRRMGATLVPYYGIEKCSRPELHVLERLRSIYAHRFGTR